MPVLPALGGRLLSVGRPVARAPVDGGDVPGGLQLARDLQRGPALGRRLLPRVAAAAAGALTHGVDSHLGESGFGRLAWQGLEARLSRDRVVRGGEV